MTPVCWEPRRSEKPPPSRPSRRFFADPTKNLFFQVGIYAWIAALAAVAVALYRAGSPRLPLLLLVPAAYFITFDHARPFGSLAFACFFLAAAWLELALRNNACFVSGRPRRAS